MRDNHHPRHPASRQRMRQRANQQTPRTGRLAGLVAVCARWIGRAVRPARHAGWVAIAAMLLVSAGALLGAGALMASGALAKGHTSAPRTRPSLDLTVIGRWHDSADGTALVIGTLQSQFVPALTGAAISPIRIEFSLPDGSLIVLAPGPSLSQLLTSLAAQPAGTAFDQTSFDCTSGILVPSGTTALKLGAAAAAATIPVLVGLTTHLGRTAGDANLLAFAGLNFATRADKTACNQSTFQYLLQAGCDQNTCFPPLPPAATVARYDSAVVNAVASQNWDPVYILTASSVTAQYNSADFTTAMNQQVRQNGRITAISPVTDEQVTLEARDGLQFFSAPQTVTVVDSHGAKSDHHITSYYLFEQGIWRFWFSA